MVAVVGRRPEIYSIPIQVLMGMACARPRCEPQVVVDLSGGPALPVGVCALWLWTS